ncbi:hypothetical protein PQH03_18860 [Ralstonia insidiosa]|jgi:hypothetical protein|uniref:hypothetical protein n=1 Tax=Ralstonia TaxID=48736 RepID=UPI000664AD7C|nr:hypothetical protein [Ralstonia insidiosa]KMW46787.1 hypothetical protein AC240_12730 [Ralstonia sp. MD27]MBX3771224.1 hypothetical protein [Ralstonia pickettii]NOZ17144.1 hypothetical protein [Betaproteobacteria bacterium]MBA9855528.1 hypothetical protein [Ralstonia insidiosa]MBA9869876.1 hypothetical protein [Ralstonia insidiosa]
MTQPAPEFLDSKRTDAHAELFDKLSKLRTLLTMLHAAGFDMFRRLDVMRRQAEYLWMCIELGDQAYQALLVSDGLAAE